MRLQRYLFLAVIAIGIVAVIGVVAWWPRGEAAALYGEGGAPTYVDATVTVARAGDCPSLEFDFTIPCQEVVAEVTSGVNRGDTAAFSVYITEQAARRCTPAKRSCSRPSEHRANGRTTPSPTCSARTNSGCSSPPSPRPCSCSGEWHGLRALIGLGVSLWLLLAFLIPSLLRGNPPLGVAIAGGLIIAGVAVYVAHGAKVTTTVALLGRVVSVLVIAVLAVVAVSFADLTGLDEGAAGTLRITADTVDLRGLLIAGIVVGSLGVLDDVTVTQVAAVVELRHSNPSLHGVALYRSALRIGRDHVAVVVNTLVLAYTGASLPLLLLFAQGDTPFGRIASSQIVAVEIVRTIVGSIGLVLSVPLTTALAAAVLLPTAPADGDDRAAAEPEEEPARTPTWEDFAPDLE